ncbi:MAG: amidohydrolase family protein [Rubripirellula sp.]
MKRMIPMMASLTFAVGALTNLLVASDQVPGAKQTQPILIQDATIHRVDEPTIAKGSVLFDDGRIIAVGKKVDAPNNSVVVDGTGKHVYPGLIESMTDLGLREILSVGESVDSRERGDRNPNVRSWVAVNPGSELIPVARAGGVLLAHVSPGGSFVRGQTSVMQLDGWMTSEMNLRAPAGLSVNWESLQSSDKDANKVAEKRDEKLAELDDWFDEATRYGAARDAGTIAVATDLRLESLLPVINGERPMFVEANRQSTIESAVAYAVGRKIRLVIYGGYDAAECADLLNRFDVPVIIAGTYRLPLRRGDAYDAPYTLPERLRKAGVKFAICGEGPGYPGGSSNARNLPYHAANAVAYGLQRDEAIRAITLSAATILGVDQQVGSVTVGKDATLILCDGDVLETETHVTKAWIQGRSVDLTSRHTMLFEKYKQKYQQ